MPTKRKRMKHRQGLLSSSIASSKIAQQAADLKDAPNCKKESVEVFYPEGPVLEMISSAKEPNYDESRAAMKTPSKNPTMSSSKTPPSGLFCALCLRECVPSLIVQLDSFECQEKLENIFRAELKFNNCSICRTCWKLAKIMADFKECCLKAESWAQRFTNGLRYEEETDLWLSSETVDMIDRTHRAIQDHLERIEFEELAAQNVTILVDSDNDEESGNLTGDDELDCESLLDSSENDNAGPNSVPTNQVDMTVRICEKCNRGFDSTIGYSKHAMICCVPPGQPRKSFHHCSICSASFLEPRLLNFHLNKHKGIKPFKCRIKCSMRFYSPMNRSKHEKCCGSDKRVCPLCRVELKNENMLSQHMTILHGNQHICCKICGRKFKSRKYLSRHMLVHTDIRKYPCGVCNKSFKSSYAAQVHQRVQHSQEKPYVCGICDKAYGYKCLLKTHMKRIHERDLA